MTTGLERLSLNQMTVRSWSVPELVDGCARAGITAVGLWREPVEDTGLARSAKLVSDAGLRVSSLCRGGFFTAPEGATYRAAIDSNRRAIDEAAALGAPCLVLVVGGLPDGSRDLRGARQRVAAALAELGPYAGERGVRLAIEPLHPMFCADRCVISSLGQALDLAMQFAEDEVGVVVDTYHVWWDASLPAQLARAADRIVCFQVCDWVVPLPADMLLGRALPGDGSIDIAGITRRVVAAGYDGHIEVEIFNEEIWCQPPAATIAEIKRRLCATEPLTLRS
jgi:sugar phosphate isomerase/epimerase